MRTDILDIDAFYEAPLGQSARDFISNRLIEAWEDVHGLRIAGFGHTAPYLPLFKAAERRLCLVPEGMGALHPACGAGASTCLTEDIYWPLPDASMDRILVVHGLEEAAAPRRLLREIWRVLADDGRLIIVVPNRRGPWAMVETTPFSAGRPFLKGQLDRFLKASMFTPLAWSSALYFPPFDKRFLLRAAKAWEQVGNQLWPGLGGVTLVEAGKQIAIPVSGTKEDVLQPRVLRPAPAQRTRIASRAEKN